MNHPIQSRQASCKNVLLLDFLLLHFPRALIIDYLIITLTFEYLNIKAFQSNLFEENRDFEVEIFKGKSINLSTKCRLQLI